MLFLVDRGRHRGRGSIPVLLRRGRREQSRFCTFSRQGAGSGTRSAPALEPAGDDAGDDDGGAAGAASSFGSSFFFSSACASDPGGARSRSVDSGFSVDSGLGGGLDGCAPASVCAIASPALAAFGGAAGSDAAAPSLVDPSAAFDSPATLVAPSDFAAFVSASPGDCFGEIAFVTSRRVVPERDCE